MPIITVEIIKKTDKRERDVIQGCSNNKKQQTKKKQKKDRKEQGGTEAILKWWELDDFVVHLS